MLRFFFLASIMLFPLYACSAQKPLFEKIGNWERRIVNNEKGDYIVEILRTKNNEGDFLVFTSDKRRKNKYLTIMPSGEGCIANQEWILVGLNTEYFLKSKCANEAYTFVINGGFEFSKFLSSHRIITFKKNRAINISLENMPYKGGYHLTPDEILNIMKSGELPSIGELKYRKSGRKPIAECKRIFSEYMSSKYSGLPVVKMDSFENYEAVLYLMDGVVGIECSDGETRIYSATYL